MNKALAVGFLTALFIYTSILSGSTLQDKSPEDTAKYKVYLGSQSLSDTANVFASMIRMADSIHFYDAGFRELKIISFSINLCSKARLLSTHGYRWNVLSLEMTRLLQEMQKGDFVGILNIRIRDAAGQIISVKPVWVVLK